MNAAAPAVYGPWTLVIINSLIFIIFAFSFTRPNTKRDWRSFGAFVQRLKAAGKPPKVIIVALMRKLVTIAQAILKSGKPFNPTLHHA